MIVFICPTVYASGGPEAIHQLASKCKKMGADVGIYYYNPDGLELDARLAAYAVPQVDELIDSGDNIFVFPESTIDDMVQIHNAVKVLWWLSVDNARLTQEEAELLRKDKSIIHFSQSFYATSFIRGNLDVEESRIFYVSDYLNTVYLNKPEDWAMAEIEGDYSTINRERLVLFNPKKGFENTAVLIMHSIGDIKWQALNGMSVAQMRKTMQKAMVYVDFGNHPGMDRIPREAASSGCCIITNKKGSANNDVDIPISNRYKQDIFEVGYRAVIDEIVEIMDNYTSVYRRDFLKYTEEIREQFRLFEICIFNAFAKINVECTESFRENIESIEDMMQSALENNELESAYRYMVRFRYEGLNEDERFCILENAIRNAMGEYDEAKFSALKALARYPESYELYLGLMQSIAMIVDRDGTASEQNSFYYEYCKDKALRYSEGTEDEDAVKEIINGI